VRQLVGDGGAHASKRMWLGRVEARRDDHEGAALGERGSEGEPERPGRKRADVDVRLHVGPAGVRPRRLEAVARVEVECRVGRAPHLLDVVGVAVAVVVVERRRVGAGRHVVDVRARADVGRGLGRRVGVGSAGRRPLHDRDRAEGGVCARREREPGEGREHEKEPAARHPLRFLGIPRRGDSLDRGTSALRQSPLERGRRSEHERVPTLRRRELDGGRQPVFRRPAGQRGGWPAA
jgi:hypothetical protein